MTLINLHLVITRLIHKFKATGWLQGHLSFSSFRYCFNEYQEFLVKSKLSLCSALSSLEAVVPSPQKGAIKLYIYLVSANCVACVCYFIIADYKYIYVYVDLYKYIYIYIYIYTYIYIYIYIIYRYIDTCIYIYMYIYIYI